MANGCEGEPAEEGPAAARPVLPHLVLDGIVAA